MEELLEISNANAVAVPEQLKKRVVEIFNLFIKTVKAKLVYPASSKLPQQFKEELFERISSVVDEFDSVAFKIEADRVLFEGIEVYRAQSRTENFAHVFFRDGILYFQMKKGIQFKELESFVDVISRMQRPISVDDDLATLLWESGIEHITYKLMDDVLNIETFEYGADTIKAIAPSKIDLQGLFENEVELDISEEDFEVPSEQQKKQRANPYLDTADSVSEFVKKVTTYDDREKAAIAEMLAADAAFNYKEYIVNLLFEVLGLEKDNAGYHESLELFAKVRDDFIKKGDFQSAILILNRIKDLEQAFKNLRDLKLDKIQGFIESFATPDKIAVIVDTLNKYKDVDFDQVSEYLMMLSWHAINPLVGALGELAHYSGRRAICRALVHLAADKIELLSKGIDDPRWYVVRNIVSVLGQIANPKAIGYFRKTIRHPDMRVRKETLVSAARIGTDEAKDFLIMALEDDNERLQILALKEVVTQRIGRAFTRIEKIVTDRNFKERSPDQSKEFLEALAILGNEKAFPVLKNLAVRTTLLTSEKQKRLRNYAVRALGYVQLSEASKLLEKIATSKNKNLADTARRALYRKTKED